MILPIIAFGNPVLKRIADEVPENFDRYVRNNVCR